MQNLVLMAGKRWGAEESNETGKGPLGWDENQFRKWESVNHHTALVGIAMFRSNLIIQRLNAAAKDDEEPMEPFPEEQLPIQGESVNYPAPATMEYSINDLMIPIGDSKVPSADGQKIPGSIGFIQLTRNEVLRLAEIATSDSSEEEKAFHLRWSKWRRRHQAISRWHHRIARMKTRTEPGSEPPPSSPVTQRSTARGRRPDAIPEAA